MDTLEEYDIKHKLFCLTSDNASNNISMVDALATMLTKENIKWDSKTQHIPCVAHIINLVVQKFLSTLVTKSMNDGANDDGAEGDIESYYEEDIGDSNPKFDGSSFGTILDKIRKIAKSIRGSSLKWEAFQRACKSYNIEPATIPLDVKV